jgi:hypothetical protein
MVMKDFTGKELKVGDLVIVAHVTGYSFDVGMKVTHVIAFCEKTNKILTENDQTFGYSPESVAKVWC